MRETARNAPRFPPRTPHLAASRRISALISSCFRLQTCLCVAQLVVLHIMYKVYPLSDYNPHPLAEVPAILNAMRCVRVPLMFQITFKLPEVLVFNTLYFT